MAVLRAFACRSAACAHVLPFMHCCRKCLRTRRWGDEKREATPGRRENAAVVFTVPSSAEAVAVRSATSIISSSTVSAQWLASLQ